MPLLRSPSYLSIKLLELETMLVLDPEPYFSDPVLAARMLRSDRLTPAPELSDVSLITYLLMQAHNFPEGSLDFLWAALS